MAVSQPKHIDDLISDAEILKYKFQYIIQSKNLEAFNNNGFFKLSPREIQEIPKFSDFDEKIKFYTLIYNCIKEINESIHRVIETGEHLKRYLTGINLKVEDVQKSLCCFFLDTFTEDEKAKYLMDDFYRSMFDDMRVLKRVNPPRDPNVQLSEPLILTGMVNIHSGTLISDIILIREYVLMCHFVEGEFERLRRHVHVQIEKHNVFTNQKSGNKVVEKNVSGPISYLIGEGIILELRNILVMENVIAEISLPDFLNCFDLTRCPEVYPQVIYKKMFVFALSNIADMNNKIALEHFNVKNYDKTKSENKNNGMPRDWWVTQNKIATLLTLPVKVISK